MTLTDAQRCQICGDSLFDDDFFSDPSQHFCLSENGPSMTAKSQVNSSDQVCQLQDLLWKSNIADS